VNVEGLVAHFSFSCCLADDLTLSDFHPQVKGFLSPEIGMELAGQTAEPWHCENRSRRLICGGEGLEGVGGGQGTLDARKRHLRVRKASVLDECRYDSKQSK